MSNVSKIGTNSDLALNKSQITSEAEQALGKKRLDNTNLEIGENQEKALISREVKTGETLEGWESEVWLRSLIGDLKKFGDPLASETTDIDTKIKILDELKELYQRNNYIQTKAYLIHSYLVIMENTISYKNKYEKLTLMAIGEEDSGADGIENEDERFIKEVTERYEELVDTCSNEELVKIFPSMEIKAWPMNLSELRKREIEGVIQGLWQSSKGVLDSYFYFKMHELIPVYEGLKSCGLIGIK